MSSATPCSFCSKATATHLTTFNEAGAVSTQLHCLKCAKKCQALAQAFGEKATSTELTESQPEQPKDPQGYPVSICGEPLWAEKLWYDKDCVKIYERSAPGGGRGKPVGSWSLSERRFVEYEF